MKNKIIYRSYSYKCNLILQNFKINTKNYKNNNNNNKMKFNCQNTK